MATEAERQAFFDEYKVWAVSSMGTSGVPASITLAQGVLESDAGKSRLAREGNNFFAIKVPGYPLWFGDYILVSDDRPNEKFRKYKTPYDSFVDHADFLRLNNRYKSLFNSTNYKTWAIGLEEAGYATDTQYAESLISIIERYNLDQYDKVGEQEMGGLENTIIRNVRPYRYQIYLLLAIIIVIAMMWIIRKKFILKK